MSSDQATGIRKSIFILKSNPMTLQAAENFLRARDWEVTSSVSLKDAITTILTKNPEYFLICANHPHKKVKQLPKVLASAFTVKTLVYVDIASALNMSLMQEFGIKAQILPPVSGPAIERAIFKFEKDELQRKEQQSRLSTEDIGSYSVTKPLSSEDARKSLSQFMSSASENENEDGAALLSTNSESSESGPIIFNKSGEKTPNTIFTNSKDTTGPRGQTYIPTNNGSGNSSSGSQSGPAYMPSGSSETHRQGSNFAMSDSNISNDQNEFSALQGNEEQGIKNENLAALSGFSNDVNNSSAINNSHINRTNNNNYHHGINQNNSNISGNSAISQDNSNSSHDPNSGESFAEYEERMRNEQEAKINSSSKKPNMNLDESKRSHFLLKKPGTKNNHVSDGDRNLDNESKISNSSTLKFSSKSKMNSESIIVKGTQHALDSASVKSTKKNVSEPTEKVSINQNCLCIVIDSTRFQGYLIAALGKNRRFDDDFMKNIQQRLFDFLKKQGESVDDEDALEIKIKPVEFEGWALEQAEFLKKSVHNGDEVAMAFFPTQKTGPEISESVKEDMVSINIDDLEGDIEVMFDVYIYLPTNNKYILYTPKGSTFFGNQKGRLKSKGISQMHMKKNEVQEAKKYSAQNYLNNKIDEYELKAAEEANLIRRKKA